MNIRHLLSIKGRWTSVLVLIMLVLSIITTHYYFSTSSKVEEVEVDVNNSIFNDGEQSNKYSDYYENHEVSDNHVPTDSDNKDETVNADSKPKSKEDERKEMKKHFNNEKEDKKVEEKNKDDKKVEENKDDKKVEENNKEEKKTSQDADEEPDAETKEKMMEEDLEDDDSDDKTENQDDKNENQQDDQKDDQKDEEQKEHKVDKETVKKVIEEIDESGENIDDKVIEKVEEILDEAIKSGDEPEPAEDSSYAMNEQDEVSEEDSKKIKGEIEELKEAGNVDSNPADVNKDWSIKLSNEIKSSTAKDLLEGNNHIKDFFQQVVNLMHGNRLSFPLEQRMRMENGKTIIDPVVFKPDWADNLNEKELEKLFQFPQEFIKDATIKHKIVSDNIPNLEPNFYEGAGYVIVGGGKYSWFALLAIETLRKVGSKLPIEVFIPNANEYEADFCEKVLPQYNARCIQIGSIFGEEVMKNIKITGYQYKSIALLASSFEHAFLLDSDNYPVKNPDHIFDSELYKTNTMITWPDYWRRTTSPHFYKITGKTIGKQVRFLDDEDTDPKYYTRSDNPSEEELREHVSLHNREGTIKEWTTESGQMVINKKVHFRALLLALYYNLEGQFGYYPLLSQGGAGEGDKETFVAASTFYNLNYYQVRKKPDRAYGYYKWSDFFVDTSIIQYDPLRDYRVLQHINREIESKIELDGRDFKYDYYEMQQHKISIEISRPMFYHVHETKMDPFVMYERKATFDDEGKKLRNLGGDFPRFGFDLEAFLWKKTKQHLCQDNTSVAFLQDNEKDSLKEEICGSFMKDQLRFLAKSNRVLRKQYDFNSPYPNLERSRNIV